jgi:hypothetical protein
MPRRGSLGMDAVRRGGFETRPYKSPDLCAVLRKTGPLGTLGLPVWVQFLEPRPPSVAGWQTGTMELDEAGENAAQRWTM